MSRVWPVGLPALWPVNSLQHPTDVLAELCPALLQQWSCHQFELSVRLSVRLCVRLSVCEAFCEAFCEVVCEAVFL